MDQLKTIYAHVFPDKSVYVGSTNQEQLYKRFQYGSGYSNQPKVYEKIMQYGWKNIEHVVLERCAMTDEEKLKKECDYTLDYVNKGYEVLNTYNTNNPYRYRPKKANYIYYTESGEEFDSGIELAQFLGVTKQAVYFALNNSGKVHGVKIYREEIKEDK